MQRLFDNQIRPQAQPINSFINPQQFRRANPGQPSLLGGVSQMATLQRAGTSSVAGFNKFEQISASLAPFSKALTKVVDDGFEFYAKSNIESGYYEEIRNEAERAKLQTQINQENGAADAAELQGQLEKIDPVGAQLFREANPWKAIGRRRALAQLAAGQVSSVVNADLVNNAGVLSELKPGSPELRARKQAMTQEVLSKFGLSGDEIESTFYVTPQVNRAWDQYTQKQTELYNGALRLSSVQAGNYSVVSTAATALTQGIQMTNGVVLRPGSAEFNAELSRRLTQQIDGTLRLLGGKDKADAWEKIRGTLGYLRANNPALGPAIQGIRVGSSLVEYEKRPTFANAEPMELMDATTKALESRNKAFTASEEAKEAALGQLWARTVGQTVYDSEEYKQALAQFQATGREMGYTDLEGYIQRKRSAGESTATGIWSPSSESVMEFELKLSQLRPKDFEDGGYTRLIAEANRAASSFPTDKQRIAKMREYAEAIEAKYNDAQAMPTGAALQGNLTRYVLEDLKDPDIAALKGSATLDPLAQVLISQGNVKDQDLEKQVRYQKYLNELRSLYSIYISSEVEKFRNDTGLQKISPGDMATLTKAGIDAARKSDDYKRLKNDALGLPQNHGLPGYTPPPNTNRQPTQRGNTDPSKGPVPAAAASTIPVGTAREYGKRAIMSQHWVANEVTRLANDENVSMELYNLAKSAGVSTDRYLLEQLRFYPALDPDGTNRKELQRRIDNLRSSITPAANNYQYAQAPTPENYNPRSPGAWLMSIYYPAQPA